MYCCHRWQASSTHAKEERLVEGSSSTQQERSEASPTVGAANCGDQHTRVSAHGDDEQDL
jgi:hypothetical protein